MTASFMELTARRQRFNGLKRLLTSLGVVEIKFSIKLETTIDAHSLVAYDLKAYDNNEEEVHFAVNNVGAIWIKELSFFVRSQFPSVQGRWKWNLAEDSLEEIQLWRTR